MSGGTMLATPFGVTFLCFVIASARLLVVVCRYREQV